MSGEDDIADVEAREGLEEEARKYGWKPKDEFSLDPEGWVDADRFLELPSTQNKKLKDEIREIQTEGEKAFNERLERLERANKAAMDHALSVQKEAHDRQIADLTAAQRKAVEEADTEEFDRLEKEKANIKPPQQPEIDLVATYSADHSWIADPYLAQHAKQLVDVGLRTGQLVSSDPGEQIKYAEERLKDYFPHKFTNPDPAPPKTSKVDGGGLAALPAKKGVNSLPPEAKRAGEEYVEQGIFKSMEDYAAAYHEQG